ncbi:MAG: hypothetical protein WAW73_20170 [Rhodoferax sp.]
MNARVIDMTGKRYSSLVALRMVGKATSGDLKWSFKCDCGSEFEANGYYARSGKITSCPTCAAERTRIASVKHGLTDSAEFEVWTGMQTRCLNRNSPAFENYGGRGISICQRWKNSFENFLADMGERPSPDHSIERENNDGNYEPSNCRWATAEEQANNKRNNVKVTIDGVTKNISAWARQFGVLIPTACLRHKQGLRGMDLFNSTVKQISHDGITDSISGWSKRTGIKPTTIAMRINKYGWSVQKALTQGVSL